MDMDAPYTALSVSASKNLTQKYAIKYCQMGWKVFQVWAPAPNGVGLTCRCYRGSECDSPGKHPIKKDWQSIATSSVEKVSTWNWEGKNIGIATGKISGLYVIDVDIKKDGMENLQKWERENEVLNPMYRVLTGSGGYHYYFPYPVGFGISDNVRTTDNTGLYHNRGGILSGVDIRGDGGLIVAPPSLHICSGRYEWEV